MIREYNFVFAVTHSHHRERTPSPFSLLPPCSSQSMYIPVHVHASPCTCQSGHVHASPAMYMCTCQSMYVPVHGLFLALVPVNWFWMIKVLCNMCQMVVCGDVNCTWYCCYLHSLSTIHEQFSSFELWVISLENCTKSRRVKTTFPGTFLYSKGSALLLNKSGLAHTTMKFQACSALGRPSRTEQNRRIMFTFSFVKSIQVHSFSYSNLLSDSDLSTDDLIVSFKILWKEKQNST